MMNLWGVMWHSKDWIDGEYKTLMTDIKSSRPALFETRKEARAWIKMHYGYILECRDMRNNGRRWFQPYPVKVKVVVK